MLKKLTALKIAFALAFLLVVLSPAPANAGVSFCQCIYGGTVCWIFNPDGSYAGHIWRAGKCMLK